MKTNFIMLTLAIGPNSLAHAQTFDEWFHQNKTELRYMHEQLIALQANIDATDDGNSIEEDGLDLVAGEEQADQTQHSQYFASLIAVKSDIAKDPSVSLMPYQVSTLKEIADELIAIATDLPFYKDFLTSCAARYTAEIENGLSEANLLLTDDQLSMQDADRLSRLRKISGEMSYACLEGLELVFIFRTFKNIQ